MIQQITLGELNAWKTSAKVFHLIDVRDEEEHDFFNIGGVLVPLEDIMREKSEFDKKEPVVVYCKRGIRSQIAIQRLQQRLPLVNFYNLQGGIYHLIQDKKSNENQNRYSN